MSTSSQGVTPYRLTRVRFDVAENTLREPAFYMWRSAHQIAQGHDGQEQSKNWTFLETGAIACAPWQDDPSNLHEKTDTAGAILRLSDYNTITGMVERPTFKSPVDLLGVTVDPSVQTTGDHFQVKTVAAGVTWAQTLQPDIDAFGQISTSPNVTIDRVAVGKTVHPENQAFVIRMLCPGAGTHYMPTLGGVYFGGPITQTSVGSPSGIFCIEFGGDGHLRLHLFKHDSGSGHFAQVSSWEGFHASDLTQVIFCQVWPHYTADGTPAIEFRTVAGAAGRGGVAAGLLQHYYRGGVTRDVHNWFGLRVAMGDPQLPVTGRGPVRVDIPRDKRPPFQISKLVHLTPAIIRDDLFALDFFPQISQELTIVWHAKTPAGTSVIGGLFDPATDLELTPSSITAPTANSKTYKLNPGHYGYYAKIELDPDSAGKVSPLLYGYKVLKNATYGMAAPGEQTLPEMAYLRQLSISGPDKDLTHETASCDIEDPAGNLTKINIRARVRTRIETEYHPTDPTKRSVLFDGFVDRADAKLKGWRGNQGLNQTGPPAVFPSPAWKQFSCTFSGIWRRLREKLTMQRVYLLGEDGTTDASGTAQPYKVTDVCWKMLQWCGFAPSEIDIPDNSTRFYPSTDGGGEEGMVEPLAEIGDVVAGFLHDYLGWFLIWDGNAGTSGMIRAIQPPPLPGPYNVLANFTLDSPSAGKLAHRPESYGSYGWVATGTGGSVAIPTCFIRKRTFQTHVKPPECNAIHVTGTGAVLPDKGGQYQLNQWAWNPKSYDFFVDGSGSPILTADPNDPDYLGEFIPLVVVNTSLSQQSSVDILTRRLYDVSAHAQKWAMFDAPLCLVIDGNDGLQANPRPLRYYDAVTLTNEGVTSTWIVRSANPYLLRGKDSMQMQHVELLNVIR